ncbi:MAG TPA: YbaK/EbsC family protein [Candidatus Limnocylindrales bacterium]|jgi:Ala-tRNA(Pro) deacylase
MLQSPSFIGPHAGLVDWLASRNVEYEIREHPQAFTAQATARAERVDPHAFVKVVGVVTDDGRRVLLAVEAVDHVDLGKAHRVLGARDVRIMTEPEFAALAPDCEAGAIPPVPELWNVPVYVDLALRDVPELAFAAGSHRYSVHVDRAAWERTSGIAYADLARDDGRPAWIR